MGHTHVSSPAMFMTVLLALLFLTFITVFVSLFDFGSANMLIAMAIASFKASLVIAFFMHLKWDTAINKIVFLSSFLFLSLLFKPRAPTLYLFELLSKTLWSAEALGAAGVGVCARAVLAGHPWSARRGRARSLGVSEECGLRIARSTSFGAGNLAGKPRAPKHWCHCQNSVLSNLPLQPRAPALRAKRLTPLHRTVGFGHYDPGYQQVLRLRLRLLTCRTPAV